MVESESSILTVKNLCEGSLLITHLGNTFRSSLCSAKLFLKIIEWSQFCNLQMMKESCAY